MSGNHRTEFIDDFYILTVADSNFDGSMLVPVIESCIKSELQSSLEYNSSDFADKASFYHASFASLFFGFVDDMFIDVFNCPNNLDYVSIQIQSKLRLGQSDLGVNPIRVENMYTCIFETFSQETHSFEIRSGL